MAPRKPDITAPDGRKVWRLDARWGVVWNPLFREVQIGSSDGALRCNEQELDLLITTLLAVRKHARRDTPTL